MYEWDDDKGPGDISVEIDLSSQIATYKRGGRTIGWSFVSTGKEGHSTTPGNYKVTEMMEVKLSNRYGWITDPAGKVSNGDAQPTTPVPEGKLGPARQKGDEDIYNGIAKRIMEENHIAINDLHTFILPRLAEVQQPKNVHFTASGSKLLGEEVAAQVRHALETKAP